jgi:hypothetical protein
MAATFGRPATRHDARNPVEEPDGARLHRQSNLPACVRSRGPEIAAISSTAARKAASLAFDGLLKRHRRLEVEKCFDVSTHNRLPRCLRVT